MHMHAQGDARVVIATMCVCARLGALGRAVAPVRALRSHLVPAPGDEHQREAGSLHRGGAKRQASSSRRRRACGAGARVRACPPAATSAAYRIPIRMADRAIIDD